MFFVFLVLTYLVAEHLLATFLWPVVGFFALLVLWERPTIWHISTLCFQRHFNQLKDELNKMKPPEGLCGGDEDDDNTDTSHSLGAENMDTMPQSCTDSEADLSKKSPSTDSASNLEKNLMDEASGQQSSSKDMSPGSSGMMLMNHMDAVESIVNDMMEPSMMNSMLFDSSAHNSLDIDDDLPLYHLWWWHYNSRNVLILRAVTYIAIQTYSVSDE